MHSKPLRMEKDWKDSGGEIPLMLLDLDLQRDAGPRIAPQPPLPKASVDDAAVVRATSTLVATTFVVDDAVVAAAVAT